MATNTGKGFRRGAVRNRTQVENKRTRDFVKRNEDKGSKQDGKFMDNKTDHTPFKGVAKEKDQRRTSASRRRSTAARSK